LNSDGTIDIAANENSMQINAPADKVALFTAIPKICSDFAGSWKKIRFKKCVLSVFKRF